MAKEFNNNEVAYLRNAISESFINEGEAVDIELDIDTPVRIIKSKKIPKTEGSIGYYVAIEYLGREVSSSSPISECKFYTKMQWNKKLKKNALMEELKGYVKENVKINLDKDVFELIYTEIENSLVTELLEERAWKVVEDTVFGINKESLKNKCEVSKRFNEVLDKALPF